MEIIINSVRFTADKKLVDFVNKKINKLDTFFDGIINAEVTLKVDVYKRQTLGRLHFKNFAISAFRTGVLLLL